MKKIVIMLIAPLLLTNCSEEDEYFVPKTDIERLMYMSDEGKRVKIYWEGTGTDSDQSTFPVAFDFYTSTIMIRSLAPGSYAETTYRLSEGKLYFQAASGETYWYYFFLDDGRLKIEMDYGNYSFQYLCSPVRGSYNHN